MRIDITKIDKNFAATGIANKEEYVWYSADDERFEIRGLAVHTDGSYLRMPEEAMEGQNDGVKNLSHHTAGGRVRFRTSANKLAFYVENIGLFNMNHMPQTGISGIDVYVNGVFASSFRPANTECVSFEGEMNLNGKVNSVEIGMPLYNGVKHLYIGVPKGKKVLPAKPYKVEVPVVYYGSSITQGGCASRPGNSYQGFISRHLNADYINLGFSGSARGEQAMAEYIASLNMSVFVMDYDHNAPTVEHLEKTHEPFFKLIRAAHPSLPVIFVSRPNVTLAEEDARRAIIKKTYDNAVSAGDANVWFVDGRKLFGKADRTDCTVDGCHPNDLGFYRMAQAIEPCVKEALKKGGYLK